MSNAETLFDASVCQEMKELIDINNQLSILEAKKKTIVDNIKNNMHNLNVDSTTLDGHTFTLVTSERRTVAKAKKEMFVATLVGLNKRHLVTTSIEPDIDSIFAEVDAGTLDKNIVDEYVKVTPVATLRCT